MNDRSYMVDENDSVPGKAEYAGDYLAVVASAALDADIFQPSLLSFWKNAAEMLDIHRK